jgi:hypothetical protein
MIVEGDRGEEEGDVVIFVLLNATLVCMGSSSSSSSVLSVSSSPSDSSPSLDRGRVDSRFEGGGCLLEGIGDVVVEKDGPLLSAGFTDWVDGVSEKREDPFVEGAFVGVRLVRSIPKVRERRLFANPSISPLTLLLSWFPWQSSFTGDEILLESDGWCNDGDGDGVLGSEGVNSS